MRGRRIKKKSSWHFRLTENWPKAKKRMKDKDFWFKAIMLVGFSILMAWLCACAVEVAIFLAFFFVLF